MIKSIENKPLDELIKLRDDLNKLITKRQREKKKELKQQFQEMAKKEGLSVDDILTPSSSKKGTKKGNKAPIKYEKDGNTWAGRGRKPKWVNELVESGGDIEDYLVTEELTVDLSEGIIGDEKGNG
ncbi:MAG: H-NS histone family protein [Candidatus Electrothrix sp. GM3_4]|nr:H-NS histone family protein [Candidatus Electrothrix sp. GM3_4]